MVKTSERLPDLNVPKLVFALIPSENTTVSGCGLIKTWTLGVLCELGGVGIIKVWYGSKYYFLDPAFVPYWESLPEIPE
ncbi:MAG: hypothetical protein ABSE82_10845 [Nitrososphaerales archaeon]